MNSTWSTCQICNLEVSWPCGKSVQYGWQNHVVLPTLGQKLANLVPAHENIRCTVFLVKIRPKLWIQDSKLQLLYWYLEDESALQQPRTQRRPLEDLPSASDYSDLDTPVGSPGQAAHQCVRRSGVRGHRRGGGLRQIKHQAHSPFTGQFF
jgi:hypothetical protein